MKFSDEFNEAIVPSNYSNQFNAYKQKIKGNDYYEYNGDKYLATTLVKIMAWSFEYAYVISITFVLFISERHDYTIYGFLIGLGVMILLVIPIFLFIRYISIRSFIRFSKLKSDEN
ncbi:hypothetical protein SDC9_113096 [bioreactor metagenome]|uniref:Uncharacterized protein n=1 Tax=bioreactor metagenome TaxID=1076179 RepID=A0A645BL52_9ZZZZ